MTNNIEALTPENFTPEQTRSLLADFCQRVGLDPSGARLLRHQTNAVYRLKVAPVIVKIARPDYSVAHIRRIVELVRWLSRLGFPTLPLLDVVQPVVINGNAATFWPYVPQARPIEANVIAEPLRQLHALAVPSISLQHMDAVAAIRYSLRVQQILTSKEEAMLVERCDHLEELLKEVRFESATCMLHGDPQHGNMLWSRGQPVLCDWDSVAVGNPEWDLITVEVHCRRFGHSKESYEEFCRIYGRDIRDWEGYPILRDLRELRMISTNARKSPPASRAANEVRKRVAQIARREPGATWSIL